MSKSFLNEYCQKSNLEYPKYVTEKAGDVFVCGVLVNNIEYKSVNGQSSKKEAEQEAARTALSNLVQLHPQAKTVQELLAYVDKERKETPISMKKFGSKYPGQEPLSSPVVTTSTLQQVAPSITPSQSSHPYSAIKAPPPYAIPAATATSASGYVPVPRPPLLGSPISSDVQAHGVMPMMTPPPKVPLPVSTSPNSPTATYFQEKPTSSQSPSTPVTMTPSKVPISYNSPYPLVSAGEPRGTTGYLRKALSEGGQALATSMSELNISTPSTNQPLYVQRPRVPVRQIMANFSHKSLSPMSSSLPPPSQLTATSGHAQPTNLSGTAGTSIAPVNTGIAPLQVGNQPRNPAPNATQPMASQLLSAVSQPLIANIPENYFIHCLDCYCQRNLSKSPKYNVVETQGTFRASVEVGGMWYKGALSVESFDGAKTNASLVALACLGIRAMGLTPSTAGAPVHPPTQSLPPHPIHAKSGLNRTLPTTVRSRGSSDSTTDATTPTSEATATPLTSTPIAAAGSSLSKKTTPPLAISFSTAAAQSPPTTTSHSSVPKLHPPSFFSTSSSSDESLILSSRSSRGDDSQQQDLPRLPSGTVSQSVLDLMAVENYKTALNTYCQQNRLAQPIYECSYPEDEVGYIVIIKVEGRAFKSTPQGTKRGAESMAASLAMKSLGIPLHGDGNGDETTRGSGGGALNRPPQISDAERNISYKNLLQEYLQKSRCPSLPTYRTEREPEGYICIVTIKLPPDGKSRSFRGKPHANKKAAEQESAKKACMELGIVKM